MIPFQTVCSNGEKRFFPAPGFPPQLNKEKDPFPAYKEPLQCPARGERDEHG